MAIIDNALPSMIRPKATPTRRAAAGRDLGTPMPSERSRPQSASCLSSALESSLAVMSTIGMMRS
jgi:hypothetical protein